MPQWELIGGDCIAAMADLALDGQVFQSIVTDPPYHLQSIQNRFAKSPRSETTERYAAGPYGRHARGFMGQKWDGGDIAFDVHTWALCWELLPPGGHLVAFSSPRTYHRMACAIEDAGFEIRDQIMWIYGSGFPKSHDVSKGIDKALGAKRERVRYPASEIRNPKSIGDGHGIEGGDRPWMQEALERGFHEKDSDVPATLEAELWQGWGTALKPAHEPIVLARKPLAGTVAGNVLLHATGALNIDATRIQMSGADRSYIEERIGGFNKTQSIGGKTAYGGGRVMDRADAYDGSKGRWPANVCHDGSDQVLGCFPDAPGQIADVSPTAPSPKTGHVYGPMKREGEASAARRYADRGATDFAPLPGQRRNDRGSAARFFYCAKASKAERHGSKHPTVKPLALLRWLVRMVTPPGGRVLDPFAGTGTTGAAARLEGCDSLLIEAEPDYQDDIRRRMAA